MIFEQLALSLKNRVSSEIFHCTVLNIFLPYRIFEQLVLALKNRLCSECTVLNIYIFIIQDF